MAMTPEQQYAALSQWGLMEGAKLGVFQGAQDPSGPGSPTVAYYTATAKASSLHVGSSGVSFKVPGVNTDPDSPLPFIDVSVASQVPAGYRVSLQCSWIDIAFGAPSVSAYAVGVNVYDAAGAPTDELFPVTVAVIVTPVLNAVELSPYAG